MAPPLTFEQKKARLPFDLGELKAKDLQELLSEFSQDELAKLWLINYKNLEKSLDVAIESLATKNR
jgi:hypothetical protein